MGNLKENEWFLVEVDGEPKPESGLYKSRSGANKKRRQFEAHPYWLRKKVTVGLWECVGPLSWKKIS